MPVSERSHGAANEDSIVTGGNGFAEELPHERRWVIDARAELASRAIEEEYRAGVAHDLVVLRRGDDYIRSGGGYLAAEEIVPIGVRAVEARSQLARRFVDIGAVVERADDECVRHRCERVAKGVFVTSRVSDRKDEIVRRERNGIDPLEKARSLIGILRARFKELPAENNRERSRGRHHPAGPASSDSVEPQAPHQPRRRHAGEGKQEKHHLACGLGRSDRVQEFEGEPGVFSEPVVRLVGDAPKDWCRLVSELADATECSNRLNTHGTVGVVGQLDQGLDGARRSLPQISQGCRRRCSNARVRIFQRGGNAQDDLVGNRQGFDGACGSLANGGVFVAEGREQTSSDVLGLRRDSYHRREDLCADARRGVVSREPFENPCGSGGVLVARPPAHNTEAFRGLRADVFRWMGQRLEKEGRRRGSVEAFRLVGENEPFKKQRNDALAFAERSERRHRGPMHVVISLQHFDERRDGECRLTHVAKRFRGFHANVSLGVFEKRDHRQRQARRGGSQRREAGKGTRANAGVVVREVFDKMVTRSLHARTHPQAHPCEVGLEPAALDGVQHGWCCFGGVRSDGAECERRRLERRLDLVLEPPVVAVGKPLPRFDELRHERFVFEENDECRYRVSRPRPDGGDHIRRAGTNFQRVMLEVVDELRQDDEPTLAPVLECIERGAALYDRARGQDVPEPLGRTIDGVGVERQCR